MKLSAVSLLLFATACGGYGSRGMYTAARPQMVSPAPPPEAIAAGNTEDYKVTGKNPWIDASKDHLSTFAADVDTASFTVARGKLRGGELPPPASVRPEEWVNYFHYSFPRATDTPFSVVMDAAPEPFAPDRSVLRVGVATNPIDNAARKPAHLVFLVDVSGSMDEPTKLPWVRESLKTLVEHLHAGDTVALVTYAGETEVVLPATGMEHRADIVAAIDHLNAHGSTAMASGLDLAYDQAMRGLAPGVTSRVIVCTDGDANVGPTSHQAILDIIAARAKAGVTLSTIGFGMGNYKDSLMEDLGDKGNGNSYYIDSLDTAKSLFGDKLPSTIEVVAKDVKLQVDFDPSVVTAYRLIGYEDRDVRDDQFRDDKVSGGQVGPGHQVTALYEVKLAAGHEPAPLGTVRVRAKAPDGDVSAETAYPMAAPPAATFDGASPDLRFAFAVAAFADIVRGNADAKQWSLGEVRELAAASAGDSAERADLVDMIDKARRLRGASEAGATTSAAAARSAR